MFGLPDEARRGLSFGRVGINFRTKVAVAQKSQRHIDRARLPGIHRPHVPVVALAAGLSSTAIGVYGGVLVPGLLLLGVDARFAAALSLPVTAVVIGMPKMEHIEENCRLAKAFRPLPANERKKLSEELASKYKAQLDLHFITHVDA